MMSFARLARISHEKLNSIGRDRFLVLAGREACLAGWLNVADRCRELVVTTNPRHFLSQSESFPDALRDEANAGFFATFDNFCSFEQAEHLLAQNGESLEDSPQDAGQAARQELSALDQRESDTT